METKDSSNSSKAPKGMIKHGDYKLYISNYSQLYIYVIVTYPVNGEDLMIYSHAFHMNSYYKGMIENDIDKNPDAWKHRIVTAKLKPLKI